MASGQIVRLSFVLIGAALAQTDGITIGEPCSRHGAPSCLPIITPKPPLRFVRRTDPSSTYICTDSGQTPWPCANYIPPSTELPASPSTTFHICIVDQSNMHYNCGGGFEIYKAGAVAVTIGSDGLPFVEGYDPGSLLPSPPMLTTTVTPPPPPTTTTTATSPPPPPPPVSSTSDAAPPPPPPIPSTTDSPSSSAAPPPPSSAPPPSAAPTTSMDASTVSPTVPSTTEQPLSRPSLTSDTTSSGSPSPSIAVGSSITSISDLASSPPDSSSAASDATSSSAANSTAGTSSASATTIFTSSVNGSQTTAAASTTSAFNCDSGWAWFKDTAQYTGYQCSKAARNTVGQWQTQESKDWVVTDWISKYWTFGLAIVIWFFW